MPKKLIEARNISKKYLIHHNPPCTTLAEAITRNFRNGFKSPHVTEEFWALQNVDLDIEEGDRIGIIGKNGAGKSTLLKILSRITEPSSGHLHIKGNVASLLEVGTGFHPELTGRENIFLNGAILGMTQKQIKKRFDDIVAFSEIEKFLDTPVKRFSSGMYMRLGFAIAAHLDPDLLIVDEVLAVGDAQFQEKCIRKLNELSSQGRTVLFVSHDIGSILTLCNKGILLEKGRVKEIGSIEHCVNAYMRINQIHSLQWEGNLGDEHIRFYRASLKGNTGKEFFLQGEQIHFEMEYEILKPTPNLVIGVGVWNQRNQRLARSHSLDDIDMEHQFITYGKHIASIPIDVSLFHEGEYLLKLESFIHNRKQILNDEISLKFPVFPRKKNSRFANCPGIEGINISSQWNLKSL